MDTFFFFFTFVYIYFVWRLVSGHKFLFLWFLLGYLFLLCNLLFWFRNDLFFFSKINHLNVARRAHVWVDLTLTSLKSCAASWGPCSPGMCSPGKWTKPLSSELLSAFLSMCSKNSALFLGHWPCIQPRYLAWAHITNSTIVMTEWYTLFL